MGFLFDLVLLVMVLMGFSSAMYDSRPFGSNLLQSPVNPVLVRVHVQTPHVSFGLLTVAV